MSGIDWSKAPEGATHFGRENGDKFLRACWYMLDEEGIYFIPADLKWSEHNVWQPSQRARNDLVARPLPVWTGSGMPPVGTACEAFNGLYAEWRKVKILDHQGGISAAVCRDDSDRLWWSNKFRPIRTPEQTAAEEKSKAINEMIRPFEAFEKISPLTVAEYLYNEGYRKFEIIDEPKS